MSVAVSITRMLKPQLRNKRSSMMKGTGDYHSSSSALSTGGMDGDPLNRAFAIPMKKSLFFHD